VNPSTHRSHSIDILRGIVMVIMALDHVREFFTNTGLNPNDITKISAGLFLTRWVTHICAPVFVFLAGTGAALSLSQGKSVSELSSFLWKRGVWMIILEITLIRYAWLFNWNYAETTLLQVFWAIGCSMIFLAVLIFLPVRIIALIGALIVFGHNALDGISLSNPLWKILHEPGTVVNTPWVSIDVLYPLLPWVGVIALGFVFGDFWKKRTAERSRVSFFLGLFCLGLFVGLRAFNLYGDPDPWITQDEWFRSVLSFVNYQKYPASLDFILGNMGIAFLILGTMEIIPALQWEPLRTFGRVPLFYYLLHVFFIHVIAIIVATWKLGYFPDPNLSLKPPPGWGFELPTVYLIWLFVVVALYPVCRWYAGFKARVKHPVLSYL
jgi:uncharacterized membrane protein